MIESVSTSGKIPPISNPIARQPSSQEVMPGQTTKNADSSSKAEPVTTKAPEPEKDVERVSEIVDIVQESMDMIKETNNHLLFSVDEQTGEMVVKVTDKDSGEVIRKIPSQEFLDLAANFEQMVGLMFDIKV